MKEKILEMKEEGIKTNINLSELNPKDYKSILNEKNSDDKIQKVLLLLLFVVYK